jgi:hypothetical protein
MGLSQSAVMAGSAGLDTRDGADYRNAVSGVVVPDQTPRLSNRPVKTAMATVKSYPLQRRNYRLETTPIAGTVSPI